MRKTITFLKMVILLSFIGKTGFISAQHLNYYGTVGGADIIMNEVMVTNTTPCSYWSTMQWGGNAGGYCGIQQQSSGTNLIFSIWDPSATNPIDKILYQLPGSNVNRFGGEGEGLHYDDAKLIGWKLNTWVRTVIRFWSYNTHTYGGFWSYDYGKNAWTHHVTFDIPVPFVNMGSGFSSFLEDWCKSPQNYRKGLQRNSYQRNSKKQWESLNTAYYGGNGTGSNDPIANAGQENGAVFMEFGGNTKKTVQEKQKLSITQPSIPVLTIGQLTNTTVSYKADYLDVSWSTDVTKSPQFSYTIKVINSSGTVVMTKKDTVPHLRKQSLHVKALAAGSYTVKVFMTDIFDQNSNEIDKTVMIGNITGFENASSDNKVIFSIYPNPCKDKLYIALDDRTVSEVTINIYDALGRIVIKDAIIKSNESAVDISGLSAGVYTVKIYDKNSNTLQNNKFIKANSF